MLNKCANIAIEFWDFKWILSAF